jgi:hypothetical protein
VCRLLRSIVSVAYRPLYLAELTKNTRTLVVMCGSCLTIRDDQVYLINKLAKDYLSDDARAALFGSKDELYYNIFSQSLKLLSSTLKRDT